MIRFLFLPSVIAIGGCHSQSAELSNEAESILAKAASADTLIVYTRFDGLESIEINVLNLIPDQSAKTVASWLAALEELKRRNYITGDGLKVGVYRVTRDGEKVAQIFSQSVSL